MKVSKARSLQGVKGAKTAYFMDEEAMPSEEEEDMEEGDYSSEGDDEDDEGADESDEDEEDVLALGSYSTCPPRDILEVLAMASEIEQDFIVTQVTHPRYRRDSMGVSKERIDLLGRSELILDSRDWSSNVVGIASSWLNLDSSYPSFADEAALEEEYEICAHLGLQAFIIDCPCASSSSTYQLPPINLSRKLLSLAETVLSTGGLASSSMQLWVRLPLNEQGWQNWQLINHLTGYNSRIYVSLYLVEDEGDTGKSEMESNEDESLRLLERWKSERVKAIEVNVNLFRETLTSSSKKGGNKKMQPKVKFTLSRKTRHSLLFFMGLFQRLHVFVSGKPKVGDNRYDFSQYLSVIAENVWSPYLELKRRTPLTQYDRFCRQYKDSLRLPLQPLKDNLESDTYRVMEMDPVKYQRYEEAIYAALMDRKKEIGESSSSKKKNVQIDRNFTITLCVIGPGRGPLIERSIIAAERAGLKTNVKICAIEKNKNAVITLRNRARDEADWEGIDIFWGDVRSVNLPPTFSKVDIIVSELLGSFGDNEASPECLVEAQKRILREGGVCIPQKYTSWCAPLSSSQLWMSARDIFGPNESKGLDAYPFVVHFHHVNVLAAELPLFTFSHTSSSSLSSSSSSSSSSLQGHASSSSSNSCYDHNRMATLSFCFNSTTSGHKNKGSKRKRKSMDGGDERIANDTDMQNHKSGNDCLTTVHGLAGFFDCTLYKDVSFSTCPHSFSEGMYSWFPVFIPFPTPMLVRNGDTLTFTCWRKSNGRQMWYEWGISSPSPRPILNANGRSFSVGL